MGIEGTPQEQQLVQTYFKKKNLKSTQSKKLTTPIYKYTTPLLIKKTYPFFNKRNTPSEFFNSELNITLYYYNIYIYILIYVYIIYSYIRVLIVYSLLLSFILFSKQKYTYLLLPPLQY